MLNIRILLFIDQCASHLKNTVFVSNIKVLFLLAKYTTQPLQKAGDEEDCNHDININIYYIQIDPVTG
jgi:hypothetical protein